MDDFELYKTILLNISNHNKDSDILNDIKKLNNNKNLYTKQYNTIIISIAINHYQKNIIEYYLKNDLISNEQKNKCYVKILCNHGISEIINCYNKHNKHNNDYLLNLINEYFNLLITMNIDVNESFKMINEYKFNWSSFYGNKNEINELFKNYIRFNKIKNIIII